MSADAVERIVTQWSSERPDLDMSPLLVIGRLHRLAEILNGRLRLVFAEFGINESDFDVLAALRRVGAPYQLSAGELSASALVTSSVVTKRVDRLERAGLVARTVSPEDGRGRLIALTEQGRELQERVHPRHLANEETLLGALDDAERAQLASLLSKLLISLD